MRPLRILMLAPEPFFEPRGTPFSEYHRIKALTELGHSVDLVTYPFGTDVSLPNLRIVRTVRPPFATRVRIGPSVTKLVLDAFLAVTAWRQSRRETYDFVHSHEEAGVLGVLLARSLGVPHLYDMHSSLPQQLTNFRFASSRVLRWVFQKVEDASVLGSDVVVTICQDLQDHVEAMGAGERVGADRERDGRRRRRAAVGIGGFCAPSLGHRSGGAARALHGYVRAVSGARDAARRDGDPREDAAGRAPARSRRPPRAGGGGSSSRRKVRCVGSFHRASAGARHSRVRRGGRHPGVAAHRGHEYAAENLFLPPGGQADRRDRSADAHAGARSETALLVRPEAEAFAAALEGLLDDPARGASLARAAAERARTRYSREMYVSRTRLVCDRLTAAGLRARIPAVPPA